MIAHIQTAYKILLEIREFSNEDQNEILEIILDEIVKDRQEGVDAALDNLGKQTKSLSELITIKNK